MLLMRRLPGCPTGGKRNSKGGGKGGGKAKGGKAKGGGKFPLKKSNFKRK